MVFFHILSRLPIQPKVCTLLLFLAGDENGERLKCSMRKQPTDSSVVGKGCEGCLLLCSSNNYVGSFIVKLNVSIKTFKIVHQEDITIVTVTMGLK